MTRTIPWYQTLEAKLGAALLALLAASLPLLIGNFSTLSSLEDDLASLVLYTNGRMYGYRILYLADRLLGPQPEDARQARDALPAVLKEVDRRFEILEAGDPTQDIQPLSDRTTFENFRGRKKAWVGEVRPALERLLALAARREAKDGDARIEAEAKDIIAKLKPWLMTWVDEVEKGSERYRDLLRAKVRLNQRLLILYAVVLVVVLGVVFRIVRGITRRTRSLAANADRIAGGDLALSTGVAGNDEMTVLGEAIDAMTANLRRMIEAEQAGREQIEQMLAGVREAISQLSSAGSEILASTTQQAAGAQEQAAAVSQTVTTVDQVAQTAAQAAQRAKGVGDAIQRTLDIGQAGRKAIESSTAALDQLKERVEATAANILMLAEQAQAIGEIIATVNDIAEQTNLLALNAAIEASRAGAHGRGFAVVAGEVKALAEQSKKATTQVRQILGEIQKATNTAVLSTEDVTKGVAAAITTGNQSGETVQALSDTLASAAQVTMQIVASAGQQATGMNQISQAMKNLEQVSRQNLAATRQVEQAARDLNALGKKLARLTRD